MKIFHHPHWWGWRVREHSQLSFCDDIRVNIKWKMLEGFLFPLCDASHLSFFATQFSSTPALTFKSRLIRFTIFHHHSSEISHADITYMVKLHHPIGISTINQNLCNYAIFHVCNSSFSYYSGCQKFAETNDFLFTKGLSLSLAVVQASHILWIHFFGEFPVSKEIARTFMLCSFLLYNILLWLHEK